MEQFAHVARGLCVFILVLTVDTAPQVTLDYSNSCLDPSSYFNNGLWSVSENPKVIHYSCHTGYTLRGPPKQECMKNGTWDPAQVPVCINEYETTSCQKPFLLNSNIENSYSTRYFKPGETITIQCSDQYAMSIDGKLQKELKLQCSQDGKWATTLGWPINPECSVQLCSIPPEIPNSDVRCTYQLGGVVNGENANYECKIGYTLVDSHDNTLVCRNGEWQGSTPSCVSIQMTCLPPEKILNGRFSEQNSYDFKLGSDVVYTCEPGYKLVGSHVLLCLGGKWSHHAPKCIPEEESTQYCPSIALVNNGHCFCETKSDMAYCEPFFPGLHVECVCKDDYKLIGQSVITCSSNGKWDYEMPTCVHAMEIDSKSSDSSSGTQSHMSTLAIVVATACSVLGVLLLIMVIMVFRRRKPHPPRLCRPLSTPPPYSRVHSNSMDEQDRMLLIGYENNQIALPSYEEATTGRSQHNGHYSQRSGQVGEYRPLPSIPVNLRSGQSGSGENSNRHSIITTSTMNRDGISEVFGSIDTVNVSMSDASTAVTVETMDSASSHHSNISRRGTAGSINSSNGSLYTEDVPLLESNQRDQEIDTGSTNEEDVQDKVEN